jgi:hypothetical protein
MWSIWNAPSDRDYYEQFGWDGEEADEPEYCGHCGARWDQACEEWCYSNAPAPEPAPIDDDEPAPTTGTAIFQIQSRRFSIKYGPYPSAAHCYQFMHEEDGLRQLAALQKGRAADIFRLVQVVKRGGYTQVECYCGDCGLMTGHYSAPVYERRGTLCSDCSLKRYLNRGGANEKGAASTASVTAASAVAMARIHGGEH